MVPGEAGLILPGRGPIDTPWDAFDDPLVGFDDPLVGFDDPLVGFDDPLVGRNEPPFGFDDPLVGLNAIWGNGGTYIDTSDPSAYGLVLFAITEGGGTPVLHQSAVLPFHITEQRASKRSGEAVPEQAALDGAYPNPFNPQTTIRYALPEAADVRLAVYDLLGREVAVLAEGTQPAGTHTATFDAAGLPSGVYLYR
ncbi:MAG: T9SS type A sorting domain-containing protein, partial [Bacteroidetes bacterium]|nr:T9SS type A sorting domain-containing protein [Bacteroidota bacterium]